VTAKKRNHNAPQAEIVGREVAAIRELRIGDHRVVKSRAGKIAPAE
jgi:hypothetical protein